MILTHTNSGGSFETKIGSLITVRLEENPTSGFRWTIERKDSLELEKDYFEKTSIAIGGAGTRVLIFRASREGAQELRMKNWRDWEGDSSIVSRFNVTILVK